MPFFFASRFGFLYTSAFPFSAPPEFNEHEVQADSKRNYNQHANAIPQYGWVFYRDAR
jgi:hypothetical protein